MSLTLNVSVTHDKQGLKVKKIGGGHIWRHSGVTWRTFYSAEKQTGLIVCKASVQGLPTVLSFKVQEIFLLVLFVCLPGSAHMVLLNQCLVGYAELWFKSGLPECKACIP